MKRELQSIPARSVKYLIEVLLLYSSKIEARSNYLFSIGRLENVTDKNLRIALTYEHTEPYLTNEMARFYRVAARFYIKRFPTEMMTEAALILNREPSSVESDRLERVSVKRREYFESLDDTLLGGESKDAAFLTDMLCVALELILNLDHKSTKSEPSEFFRVYPTDYSDA